MRRAMGRTGIAIVVISAAALIAPGSIAQSSPTGGGHVDRVSGDSSTSRASATASLAPWPATLARRAYDAATVARHGVAPTALSGPMPPPDRADASRRSAVVCTQLKPLGSTSSAHLTPSEVYEHAGALKPSNAREPSLSPRPPASKPYPGTPARRAYDRMVKARGGAPDDPPITRPMPPPASDLAAAKEAARCDTGRVVP